MTAWQGPIAAAQGLLDGWDTDVKAGAVVAISTFDDVERLPAENVLGEVNFRLTAEKTLQNSAEIGIRFEVKAQQDNPARAGFTGNIEPLAFPDDLIIPAVFVPQVRGAFSGLTRGGEVENAGLSGAIETAQIYMDGGYGQVSAGLGRGVAARFHEGAPDVFTHVRVANPKLDPAGFNVILTENNLTGPAPKITYQTPRILGVRAGLSYTLDANVSGVDRDPARSVAGVVTPDIENVIEGSVQISRKIPNQDIRLRASASYAQGQVSVDDHLFEPLVEDVMVWNAGAEIELKSVTFGGEYLKSNNGIQGPADYQAWSVGAKTQAFDWDFAVRYGQAEDENIQTEAQNWSIGAVRSLSQNVDFAVGYHSNDVDYGQLPLSNPESIEVSGADGVVVEITLSL